MQQGKGRRILIVDADRDTAEILSGLLTRDSHAVSTAADSEAAIHKVKAWKPHLVLISGKLLPAAVDELVQRVRLQSVDEYVSVMVVCEPDDASKDVELGADDFLLRPLKASEVGARVRAAIRVRDLHEQLRRSNHRIEELGSTDDLTGLLNMRAFQRVADDAIVKCRRFRKPISALLVNLDRFSAVNRDEGFPFANHVLREVGKSLRKCVRSMDPIARVGGDEFLILLVETDLASAEFVAEKIRDLIHGEEIRLDRHHATLTACIGVAGFPYDQTQGDLTELFRNAQEAVRSAKALGPNRTEVYSLV